MSTVAAPEPRAVPGTEQVLSKRALNERLIQGQAVSVKEKRGHVVRAKQVMGVEGKGRLL